MHLRRQEVNMGNCTCICLFSSHKPPLSYIRSKTLLGSLFQLSLYQPSLSMILFISCQRNHVYLGPHYCSGKWCLYGKVVPLITAIIFKHLPQAIDMIQFIKHYGTELQNDLERLDSLWASFIETRQCVGEPVVENKLYPLIWSVTSETTPDHANIST